MYGTHSPSPHISLRELAFWPVPNGDYSHLFHLLLLLFFQRVNWLVLSQFTNVKVSWRKELVSAEARFCARHSACISSSNPNTNGN